MTRIMTFADICERAHPTAGNARVLFAIADDDADLHELCAMGAAFEPATRRELGAALVRCWLARGKPSEARAIARDPAYRDLLSIADLYSCGAQDEIAHRRRQNLTPIPAGDLMDALDDMDEIDLMGHYSEMPGGGR